MPVKLEVGKAVMKVAKKGYKVKKKRDWAAKKKKIMEGITMKYQEGKTFDAAEKAVDKKREEHKSAEPKRGNFPKGKVGDIKFKVAYRAWLEKTL